MEIPNKNKKTKKPKLATANFRLVLVILVIVIVLVLMLVYFTLRSMYVGNPGALPLLCTPKSEYICQRIGYFHGGATAGNIIVQLGQNTGAIWTGTNFIFVPEGTTFTNGIPNIGGPAFSSYPANTTFATNPLQSGENVTVYLPATGSVQVGTPLTGTIWATYTTTPGGVVTYTQMATLNIKAS